MLYLHCLYTLTTLIWKHLGSRFPLISFDIYEGKNVLVGLQQFGSGLWNIMSARQDISSITDIGEAGFMGITSGAMGIFSDPSSAIIEADNPLGFQLAPAAVLPVAALAYLLLFRDPIQSFVDGIISK